jgi:hypothetical protein
MASQVEEKRKNSLKSHPERENVRLFGFEKAPRVSK